MVTVKTFLIAVFDAPMRRAVAILWFVGAMLGALAAVLSFIRPGAGPYWVFLIPMALLLLIACSVLASKMWALGLSFVLLLGQVLGIAGTALELVYGVNANKAAELRALGFDPRLGVSINLAFSLAAVGVLAVALLRARRAARIASLP
jgi:hypothetical protein